MGVLQSSGGRRALIAAAGLLAILCGCAPPVARGQTAPLVLERTIVLKDVAGRIDHLAVDVAHGRLFVAELGAGSVDAVDLRTGGVIRRVAGLKEPQGLAYLPAQDQLAVAGGGDGVVRFFHGADLAPAGLLALGDDADNLRFDSAAGRLVAGFGSGALAVIDPASHRLLFRIPLPAHPEGFQLDGVRAYVNAPGARGVYLLDLSTGRQISVWPNGWLSANYPLALDAKAGVAATVYRLPPTLAVVDLATGERRQAASTCADADDVFFDPARHRIYVVCGAGAVDVFEASAKGYVRLARVSTTGGARTGLFVPQLDRLFVAARAQAGSRDAAILVFRPSP